MATTNFVTGTLIEADWLNDVDEAVYESLALKAPLASPTFTGTVTLQTPFTLGAVSVTATGTELNYVDGVTSAIQTQLDEKAALAGATFTGAVTSEGILSVEAGLAFPVIQVTSADPNILDDYEEGAWTPEVVFGADAATGVKVGMTGTYSGSYTKVGNKVTFNGKITLTAKGSSTGNAWIKGLPFASAENNMITLANQYLTYTGIPQLVTAASNYMFLYQSASTGAWTQLSNTAFANNTTLYFSGSYLI